jgi:hypothetical protein
MQRKLFLLAKHRTSVLHNAFPKASPSHISSRMQCSKSCQLEESINVFAFREFSTSPCKELCFPTSWREGFHSKREFCRLRNPRLKLHPIIFAEEVSCCRYHSTRGFHPICDTATVNNFSNNHAGYIRTQSNLTDRLNASRCIQPPIRHC